MPGSADLLDDLDGEMRRLSAFLGIPVDEAGWPALVEAARFSRMRAKSGASAPGAHLGEWRDADAFFRKARLGEWREGLSPGSLALYDKLSRERLGPRLKLWLEGGRGACDPKAR